MVEVILISKIDNLAAICDTATDVNLDMFRHDNLRQVLQRVQNIVAMCTINNLTLFTTPLVQSLRPHLLL